MRRLRWLAFPLFAVVAAGCFGIGERREFVDWARARSAAAPVTIRDGVAEFVGSDGSVESRELPAPTPEERAIEIAATGVQRSAETGSPWAAVSGVLGAAATILGGLTLRQRAKTQTRDTQLRTVVQAIGDERGSPMATRLADAIKSMARAAGVEDGPDGLRALVEELGANVLKHGSGPPPQN